MSRKPCSIALTNRYPYHLHAHTEVSLTAQVNHVTLSLLHPTPTTRPTDAPTHPAPAQAQPRTRRFVFLSFCVFLWVCHRRNPPRSFGGRGERPARRGRRKIWGCGSRLRAGTWVVARVRRTLVGCVHEIGKEKVTGRGAITVAQGHARSNVGVQLPRGLLRAYWLALFLLVLSAL